MLQAAANELMVAEEEQARWQSSIDQVGSWSSRVLPLFSVVPSDKSQLNLLSPGLHCNGWFLMSCSAVHVVWQRLCVLQWHGAVGDTDAHLDTAV